MNILILKIGALGDVLRTSFIAQALKEKYREYNPKIIWITDKKADPLFTNNPYVDLVIINEEKHKVKDKKFDLVINLEEDEENCRFASSLDYGQIIGFFWSEGKIAPTPSAREWFNMSILGEKPYNNLLKKKNKKTHRQILGEIIEVNWKKYIPFLRLTLNQRKIAENFLRRYNLKRTDLIIGLNTGSADRWPKALPIKKTIELARQIYKKFNAKILLFGGPLEIERNQQILSLANVPIIDTGCGNNLIEFPALISLCNLVITTDSSGLHVALALKRKTICMIGPTSVSEIDMYGLGEKTVAKSKCISCYKKNCQSMSKIVLNEILKAVNRLISQKITLFITANKENCYKIIKSAVSQNTRYNYNIIISALDDESINVAKSYAEKDPRIKIFYDSGKERNHVLNDLFPRIDTDIMILADCIEISDNSVEEISNLFLDPEIGCATGRPVPVEGKNTKYGYWANFLFDAANKIRKQAFENHSFMECSGGFLAFRKNYISNVPLHVATDAVISYIFWEKGYKIGYAENSKIYVKNLNKWKDWIKYKTLIGETHEALDKYFDIKITPRIKTFKNEASKIFLAFKYPKTFKEMFWTFQLILSRLFMWFGVLIKTHLKKNP